LGKDSEVVHEYYRSGEGDRQSRTEQESAEIPPPENHEPEPGQKQVGKDRAEHTRRNDDRQGVGLAREPVKRRSPAGESCHRQRRRPQP
jgi:hypothetical protein